MRFRIEGVNWEGRAWKLTKGGVTLAREVEAIWPDRHPTDGTVASKGHDERNPNSDHRPRPFTGPGVVRALDVGENTEGDGETFAEMLRATRDPRIKYVLHEDRIFSSYARPNREPWEWGPLKIGHESHVHVSFTALSDSDDSPWHLVSESVMYLPIEPDQDRDEDIRALRRLLDNAYGTDLGTSPNYDQSLVDAVKAHLGSATNHPEWKEGKGVGGLQYAKLISDIQSGAHNHDGRYVKDVTIDR